MAGPGLIFRPHTPAYHLWHPGAIGPFLVWLWGRAFVQAQTHAHTHTCTQVRTHMYTQHTHAYKCTDTHARIHSLSHGHNPLKVWGKEIPGALCIPGAGRCGATTRSRGRRRSGSTWRRSRSWTGGCDRRSRRPPMPLAATSTYGGLSSDLTEFRYHYLNPRGITN